MSEPGDTRGRMAETVRLVVTRRERAARSPAMERAFKRLIWRYSDALQAPTPDDPAAEPASQAVGLGKSGPDDPAQNSNRDPTGFDQR